MSDIVAADEDLQDQSVLSDLLSAVSMARKFPLKLLPYVHNGEPLQHSECMFTKWALIKQLNVAHNRPTELDVLVKSLLRQ